MFTHSNYVIAYSDVEMVLTDSEYDHIKKLYTIRNHYGMTFECFVYYYLYEHKFH